MKYSQAKRHFISRITISKNLTLRKIVTLLSIIYLSIIITRTSKYKRIERKNKWFKVGRVEHRMLQNVP